MTAPGGLSRPLPRLQVDTSAYAEPLRPGQRSLAWAVLLVIVALLFVALLAVIMRPRELWRCDSSGICKRTSVAGPDLSSEPR